MDSIQAYCHREYDFTLDTIKDIETLQSNFAMNDINVISQCVACVRALTDVSVLPYLDSLTKEILYRALLDTKD